MVARGRCRGRCGWERRGRRWAPRPSAAARYANERDFYTNRQKPVAHIIGAPE